MKVARSTETAEAPGWHAAKSAGYPDPAWMTYRQALALDANVRKGEKGTHIVFARKLTVKKEEDEERQISMLRSYTVFNVAQIDGLPRCRHRPGRSPHRLRRRGAWHVRWPSCRRTPDACGNRPGQG